MQTLETGKQTDGFAPRLAQRLSQRGVTLVEMLVVLMIIAMLAGVVAINAPPPAGAEQRAAERFAARLDFASAYAVTAGVVVGLEIAPDGYQYYQYDRGEWRMAMEPQLKGDRFSADIAVDFELPAQTRKNEPAEAGSDDEEAARPVIMFSPTGETTPFHVRFNSRRGERFVALDGAGVVKLSNDDDQ